MRNATIFHEAGTCCHIYFKLGWKVLTKKDIPIQYFVVRVCVHEVYELCFEFIFSGNAIIIV